ncbi:hypothetical protein GDO78_001736 [Eleutherodactylus coqui]|uniref:Uncharacterized protein n=1 Tax=Eleutherodactylus coqui TaxID=57060 RepID=A0A8J6FW34_ELECQ|nr:hypothetical protein GDO78_001736 [Eleutherodactylus coqui]
MVQSPSMGSAPNAVPTQALQKGSVFIRLPTLNRAANLKKKSHCASDIRFLDVCRAYSAHTWSLTAGRKACVCVEHCWIPVEISPYG